MSNPLRQKLRNIKGLIASNQYVEALKKLSDFANPLDDFSIQHQYARLFGNIPCGELDLKPIKIGLVGTGTMEHFAQVFRFWMAKEGFDANILHNRIQYNGSKHS